MKIQSVDRISDIPFWLALHAVEITEFRLRNWLILRSVYFDADKLRQEGIHRKFTRLDLVRMGVVLRLTNLGRRHGATGFSPRLVSVNFENLLAQWVLQKPDSPKEDPVLNTPEPEILNLLCGSALTIFYINHEPRTCWLLHSRQGWQEEDEGNTEASIQSDTTITVDIGRLMQDRITA